MIPREWKRTIGCPWLVEIHYGAEVYAVLSFECDRLLPTDGDRRCSDGSHWHFGFNVVSSVSPTGGQQATRLSAIFRCPKTLAMHFHSTVEWKPMVKFYVRVKRPISLSADSLVAGPVQLPPSCGLGSNSKWDGKYRQSTRNNGAPLKWIAWRTWPQIVHNQRPLSDPTCSLTFWNRKTDECIILLDEFCKKSQFFIEL